MNNADKASDELLRAMKRINMEFDISTVEMLGVLEEVKMVFWQLNFTDYSDEYDEDIEPEQEDDIYPDEHESWKGTK